MAANTGKETAPAVSRRRFLDWLGLAGFSGAVAAAISAPAITRARASGGEGGESIHRWGIVIDLSKCIGCEYCVYACQAVNDASDQLRWNLHLPDVTATGQLFHMTRPCMHCQEAPCVAVCPVQATWIRADGIVMMNYERCIGCRYCMVACPYDARRFNWEARTDTNPYEPQWGSAEVPRRPRGVAEKCTFCVQRIDRGLETGRMPGGQRAATPAG